MTYNQIIALFRDISAKHKQIKTFRSGEEWEISETLKAETQFPFWYASLIDIAETENTRNFSFNMICFGNVKKDKSNEDEVLSDCQSILSDIKKIFQNESDSYDLVNEPVMVPFKEKYSAFTAGHKCEMTIETDINNNYCDVPADNINAPVAIPGYGIIKNIETGEIIKKLVRGEVYYIEIVDTIEQSLGTVTPTIIQVLT